MKTKKKTKGWVYGQTSNMNRFRHLQAEDPVTVTVLGEAPEVRRSSPCGMGDEEFPHRISSFFVAGCHHDIMQEVFVKSHSLM